jgi:hypothetical protein
MRRRFAGLGLAALTLAGCAAASGAPQAPESRPGAVPTVTGGAAPTTASQPAPVVTPVGTPSTGTPQAARSTAPAAGETLPEAKRLASDTAVALTTYGPGSNWADVIAAVDAAPAAREALAASGGPLVHPGQRSQGTVVYAQLGGFRAERASVMVVVRQDIGPAADGSGARSETRTIDVRLARSGGRWSVEGLASVGGDPVPRPAGLSPVAAAVVDNPRIELPDSARWDIYRGAVSPHLLTVLAAAAEQAPLGIVVLESGHPHDVFGTGRTSSHTVGRAADVYRVGGTKVIDGRAPGSEVDRLARWLLGRPELSQLGSPWRLGANSFTDVVHQDHVHIAVR